MLFLWRLSDYRGFFFFQAEDGIRDADVTGVQTCALPISGGTQPPAGIPPLACTQTPDCPRNLACSAGFCSLIPPGGGTGGSLPPIPCASSTSCPSGLSCASGICGGPNPGSIPPISCGQTSACP